MSDRSLGYPSYSGEGSPAGRASKKHLLTSLGINSMLGGRLKFGREKERSSTWEITDLTDLIEVSSPFHKMYDVSPGENSDKYVRVHVMETSEGLEVVADGPRLVTQEGRGRSLDAELTYRDRDHVAPLAEVDRENIIKQVAATAFALAQRGE